MSRSIETGHALSAMRGSSPAHDQSMFAAADMSPNFDDLYCTLPSKIAALEQIVEPADPIPAIAVSLEADAMLAALAGAAVLAREQIDQELSLLAGKPGRELHLARLAGEIV